MDTLPAFHDQHLVISHGLALLGEPQTFDAWIHFCIQHPKCPDDIHGLYQAYLSHQKNCVTLQQEIEEDQKKFTHRIHSKNKNSFFKYAAAVVLLLGMGGGFWWMQSQPYSPSFDDPGFPNMLDESYHSNWGKCQYLLRKHQWDELTTCIESTFPQTQSDTLQYYLGLSAYQTGDWNDAETHWARVSEASYFAPRIAYFHIHELNSTPTEKAQALQKLWEQADLDLKLSIEKDLSAISTSDTK
jgi:hypothetical protein